jgi:tRNA dimethylallyltransferase
LSCLMRSIPVVAVTLMKKLHAILIAGPTASGKSSLAMALAREYNGVIINADSMQVYSDLRVLTARPTAEEMAAVPHTLYGHVDGAEAYSAGRFQSDVATAIDAALTAGLRPVITGGTGLYFKALLEGLSPIPPVPDDIRRRWRSLGEEHGAYALWQMLTDLDPEMAFRLDPNDLQRITRAHEVMETTGRSLAYWQQLPGKPILREEDTIRLVVKIDREELYGRCDTRLDAMMAHGAVEEVRALAMRGLSPELPVMRAVGVRPLMQHEAGNISREEAVSRAKTETRQYAKRQLTWIKGNMRSWKPIHLKEMESLRRDALSFINW